MLYNVLNTMKAKSLGPGKFSDGQGLWLIKRNRIHGKWILRFVIRGRRREMGLGRWPDVSIAEARERAYDARRSVRDGIDPIEERRKARLAPRHQTVAEVIAECFEAKKLELKGDRNADQWLSPLRVHVIPKIGSHAIESIDQHVAKSVLQPLWSTQPAVAKKVLGRLNIALHYAAALGLDVDLQATAKAKALLGKQKHVPKHVPALHYAEVPAFYRMLSTKQVVTCRALQLLILTATRTSEVRLATYKEIEGDTWIIPAERTKSGREHRVPLSRVAENVIRETRVDNDHEWLFPTVRGKALSNMAMSMFMRKGGYDARPHGFRSSFRTWAENESDATWDVKEASLGHSVGSAVERAYQRSDRLEQRRKLMDEWAAYLLPSSH